MRLSRYGRLLHGRNSDTRRWIDAEALGAPYQGASNYGCLAHAGDGAIYYTLGSREADGEARLLRFDPGTRLTTLVAHLSSAVGEAPPATIPQGKTHVGLFEHSGRLYTATHIGYYKRRLGRELPAAPPGRGRYPGGHLVAYDLTSGRIDDLARAPAEEGIIAMTLDRRRGQISALTWPGGLLLTYQLESGQLRDHGPVFGAGEWGRHLGLRWRRICRTIVHDPDSGDVYWSDDDGCLFALRHGSQTIELVRRRLAEDSGATGWRALIWRESERAFYGILSGSCWLFRFEPAARKVELLDQLRPRSVRRRLRLNQSPTLALRLAEDGETLLYLATGPGLLTATGRINSTVHLLTYHLPSRTTREHGILRLPDGRYPVLAESIEQVGDRIYSVPWLAAPTRAFRRLLSAPSDVERVQLISFPLPPRN
jgi:hypothetical protein